MRPALLRNESASALQPTGAEYLVISLVFASRVYEQHALGADSPSASFFAKLRGRAAQTQRYAASSGWVNL